MASPKLLCHRITWFTFRLKKLFMSLKKLFYNLIHYAKPDSLIIKFLNEHDLKYLNNKNIYLIGFGKAVMGFLKPLSDNFGNQIKCCILSVPEPTLEEKKIHNDLFNVPNLIQGITTIYYGNRLNKTNETVLDASKHILDLIKRINEDDCLMVAITGGGSALLCMPHQNIKLKDIVHVTELLSHCGASIKELNSVRQKLDVLKGGGICYNTNSNTVVSLILSDVIGDDLSIIASGPTVVEQTKKISALDILKKYNLIEKVSPQVIECVKSECQFKERPSQKVRNYLIGNNRMVLEDAAIKVIHNEPDRKPIILTDQLSTPPCLYEIASTIIVLFESLCQLFLNKQMETNSIMETKKIIKTKISSKLSCLPSSTTEMIEYIDIMLLNVKLKDNIKLCFLLGGEVPVKITSDLNNNDCVIGSGGRCTHMALQLAILINQSILLNKFFDHINIEILCGATDGMDGALDCAGAIVNMETIKKAQEQGLDGADFLNRFDSFNFFRLLSDGQYFLKTGLTGTNIMDIFIINFTINRC